LISSVEPSVPFAVPLTQEGPSPSPR
jgi:hypothetical protein